VRRARRSQARVLECRFGVPRAPTACDELNCKKTTAVVWRLSGASRHANGRMTMRGFNARYSADPDNISAQIDLIGVPG
jgi:hypothetical protein